MELVEYVPGSLYYLSSHAPPRDCLPPQLATARVVHVAAAFPYANFFLDFGPLPLAHVAAFARALDETLGGGDVKAHGKNDGGNDGRDDGGDDLDDDDDNQRDADAAADAGTARPPVCVYSSPVPQHRANAVCLFACWAVLGRKWSAHRALAPFHHVRVPSFHDASPNVDSFGLRVRDVVRGLERAVASVLLPPSVLRDPEALQHDPPDTAHGHDLDLSWITPRVAAFAGPQAAPPKRFVEYFRATGVTLVVRLNRPQYDKRAFARAGIQVVDLYFPDGTCPPDSVVTHFLALCSASKTTGNKLAVHCRAGLGRTGTLIACHLMHAFAFSAEQAIGWLRLCRPGSVVGGQQRFLRELPPRLAELLATSQTKKAAGDGDDGDDPPTPTPEAVGFAIDEVEEEEEEDDDDDDDDQQQNVQPPPRSPSPKTKGIAARMAKPAPAATKAPTLPPRYASPFANSSSSYTSLPPRIPGRRAAPSTARAMTTPSTWPHASQADLLLLRKHAQQSLLPFVTTLWPPPPAPSTVGGATD